MGLESFDRAFAGWKHSRMGEETSSVDEELGRTTDKWEYKTHLPGRSRVYVAVYLSETGGLTCRVEFNPSRVLNPHGTALAPASALPGLLRCLLFEHLAALGLDPTFEHPARGNRWLPPVDPMSLVSVRLLHFARDFTGLEDPSVYAQAVYVADQKGATPIRKANHSDAGRLQSIVVGNGSGEICVYDKSAESLAKKRREQPEPGSLRVEQRYRRGWLVRFGLTTLDRVTNDAVARAFVGQFRWSGADRSVTGPTLVLRRLASLRGLTPAKRMALVGYVTMRSNGLDHGLPRDKVREFDAILRRHGMPSGKVGFGELSLLSERRLDLARGVEVFPSRRRVVTRRPNPVLASVRAGQ